MIRLSVDKLDRWVRISAMVRILLWEERTVAMVIDGWDRGCRGCRGCRFVVFETIVVEESRIVEGIIVVILLRLLWVKLLLLGVVLVWLLWELGLLWVLRLCRVVSINFIKRPVSIALMMLKIAIVAFTSVK